MVKLLQKVRNMLGTCTKIFMLPLNLEWSRLKCIANIQLQSQHKANLSIIPTNTPPTNAPGMVMGPKEVLNAAALNRYSDRHWCIDVPHSTCDINWYSVPDMFLTCSWQQISDWNWCPTPYRPSIRTYSIPDMFLTTSDINVQRYSDRGLLPNFMHSRALVAWCHTTFIGHWGGGMVAYYISITC